MINEFLGTKLPAYEYDMLINFAVKRKKIDFVTDKHVLIYYTPSLLSHDSKKDIEALSRYLKMNPETKDCCRIILMTPDSMVSCQITNE